MIEAATLIKFWDLAAWFKEVYVKLDPEFVKTTWFATLVEPPFDQVFQRFTAKLNAKIEEED